MIVPLLQPLIVPPHLPTYPTLCSFSENNTQKENQN